MCQSLFLRLPLCPRLRFIVFTLFLSLSLSVPSAVESCNRDLVHPYRDNDRSPVDTVADIYGDGGAMLK